MLVSFDMMEDHRTGFLSKLSEIFEPIYLNIFTRGS